MSEPSTASKTLPHTAAVLDVHSIDSYLLDAFVVPKALSLFRSILQTNDYEKWSNLLRSVTLPLLQIATVLFSRGQTPASRLLGVKLSSYHCTPQGTADVRLHRLFVYCFARFVIPTFYQKWKDWFAKRRQLETFMTSDESTQSSGLLSSQRNRDYLALQRQGLVADAIIHGISRVAPMVQLVALLSCWSGVSNTPDAAMLATGLTYCNAATSSLSDERRLHVSFAHNRWLGEHLMETIKMLFLSSFITSRQVWTPVLRSAVVDPLRVLCHWIHKRIAENTEHFPLGGAIDNCPICLHRPSTTAVRTNCGHVYCYACLYYHEQQSKVGSFHGVRCKVCRDFITRATIWEP